MKEGKGMTAVIVAGATPKEIAALVAELQGQQLSLDNIAKDVISRINERIAKSGKPVLLI